MKEGIKNMNIRIALFEPRIPQNTGNIARTCAAFNFRLDLISPLGFSLDDKYLKRAGLDYWKYVDIDVHKNFNDFLTSINSSRLLGFSKKSNKSLSSIKFMNNDVILFGREDTGLPDNVIRICTDIYKIPMPGAADANNAGGVRSLNLSVACGIVAYQASNQLEH